MNGVANEPSRTSGSLWYPRLFSREFASKIGRCIALINHIRPYQYGNRMNRRSVPVPTDTFHFSRSIQPSNNFILAVELFSRMCQSATRAVSLFAVLFFSRSDFQQFSKPAISGPVDKLVRNYALNGIFDLAQLRAEGCITRGIFRLHFPQTSTTTFPSFREIDRLTS